MVKSAISGLTRYRLPDKIINFVYSFFLRNNISSAKDKNMTPVSYTCPAKNISGGIRNNVFKTKKSIILFLKNEISIRKLNSINKKLKNFTTKIQLSPDSA